MPKQVLLFIEFVAANTFAGVRAVPQEVDFKDKDVARVWTMFRESDKDRPPTLPIHPRHRDNAFLEDYVHDWNIDNKGRFRYASRVSDRAVWVLVELK